MKCGKATKKPCIGGGRGGKSGWLCVLADRMLTQEESSLHQCNKRTLHLTVKANYGGLYIVYQIEKKAEEVPIF